MSRVSGKIIASIPKFVKKKFGAEGFQRWMDAISSEAFLIYSLPVKEDQWYPLKTALIEPTANIAHIFFKWDVKKAAWEMGRFSADARFKGPLKVLVKIPKPNFFITKGTGYLPMYYDPCEMEIVENRERDAVVRITHFPEIEITTENRIGGWIQRGLEINGCSQVTVEITKSLARFEAYTEYQISWR